MEKGVYGGPFKARGGSRRCNFLLSVFGLYIPFHTVILGVSPYINKLEGSNTVDKYGLYILWFSFDKLCHNNY